MGSSGLRPSSAWASEIAVASTSLATLRYAACARMGLPLAGTTRQSPDAALGAVGSGTCANRSRSAQHFNLTQLQSRAERQ